MRKKIRPWMLICLLLLVGLYLAFRVQPVVHDASTIQDLKICYYDSSTNTDMDVTSRIDIDQLRTILADCTCRRSLELYTGLPYADGTFHINFIADQKPVYIVLGKINYCYASAEMLQMYDLQNGDAVLRSITALLPSDLNATST